MTPSCPPTILRLLVAAAALVVLHPASAFDVGALPCTFTATPRHPTLLGRWPTEWGAGWGARASVHGWRRQAVAANGAVADNGATHPPGARLRQPRARPRARRRRRRRRAVPPSPTGHHPLSTCPPVLYPRRNRRRIAAPRRVVCMCVLMIECVLKWNYVCVCVCVWGGGACGAKRSHPARAASTCRAAHPHKRERAPIAQNPAPMTSTHSCACGTSVPLICPVARSAG